MKLLTLNKQTKLTIIFIIVAILVTIFLRVTRNTVNPPGLNVDEVAFGYNAYSILKTARDEYGKFMPLSFQSYGDYKNPVAIYILVPLVAIFGLNDFSIRLISIIVAAVSVPVFYLFFYKLTKDRLTSIIGIILLTLSPWHIFYSRFYHENIMASLFIVTGVLFFLSMCQSKRWYLPVLSAFFLCISTYTYYAPRLFVPTLYLLLIVIFWKELIKARKTFVLWIITTTVLFTPLALSVIFGHDSARAAMTFFANDIEFKRNILVVENGQSMVNTLLQKLLYYLYLFFFWTTKYLNYFQPGFIFFKGLDMTTTGTIGSGVLYLFEAPFLLFGLMKILRNRHQNTYLYLGWIILGIFPASLTIGEDAASRALLILPIVILISATGAKASYDFLRNRLSTKLFKLAISVYALFIFWNLVKIFFVFNIHFPYERGEYFMEGTREAITEVLQLQGQYDEVVFDPTRGVTGPTIVSVPHMYYLFYSKFDPQTYQQANKTTADNNFHIGKFTVRDINWRLDRSTHKALFVGSPWSLPLKDVDPQLILKKVYLKNGDLVLLVVGTR